MVKYPNLDEFRVEDELLEQAIGFQVHKQMYIDGRRLLARLWAADTKGKSAVEIEAELRALSETAFDPDQHAIRYQRSTGPAKVVYFAPGPPHKVQDWRGGFLNSRPYFFGVSLNREMTAPGFMKWVDREFIPFVKASMKLAARIQLPGAIEFTAQDEAVFRRVGGETVKTHNTKIWYRTKDDAVRENLSNKARQSPSLKKLRAKLLSVACYRFKMAGFTFREYNEAQRSIGLEVYAKRNSAPVVVDITEEAYNGRLKIATGLLREEWRGLEVEKPEDIPEAGFALGKRFR